MTSLYRKGLEEAERKFNTKYRILNTVDTEYCCFICTEVLWNAAASLTQETRVAVALSRRPDAPTLPCSPLLWCRVASG